MRPLVDPVETTNCEPRFLCNAHCRNKQTVIDCQFFQKTDAGDSTDRHEMGVVLIILRAVMSERIGERHASACRYKNEVPEGSRHSARRTHFWPREV